MSKTTTNPLLREVRQLIGAGDRDDVPDGHLLDRFVRDRDETAFEVLVRRYGRLVFGVCRRVLSDPHTAEDAFQATFLVLVHKAGALDRRRPVADWLYTVAFRLALRARANAARRRAVEANAARNRADVACTESDDLAAAVHEELNRLPDQHRVPLVLSYLEGRTYEQVARAIGCPVATVGHRLARAKDALRDRLVGRGLSVPAAGLAAAFAASEAGAVPASLIQSTVRAGVWFAADPVAGATVASAEAIELAKGVIGAMTTSKLTVAAGMLLAVGLSGGTAWMARSAAMSDAPTPATAARVEPAPAEQLPPAAMARLGSTSLRHGEAIFFIAYTPDGRHLVTAGQDRAIRLWDRKTGREVRSFDRTVNAKQLADPKPAMQVPVGAMVMRAPANPQFPIALSPDGRLLAAGRDRTLFVWEVGTGEKRHELTAAAPLTDLHFTPDGNTLVAADTNRTITHWDPAAGKTGRTFELKQPGGNAVGKPDGPIVTGLTVSPDGTHAVRQVLEPGAGNAVLKVRNLETGAETEVKLGAGGVQNLTFSPDGKQLAWTSFLDGIVVWDVEAGKELCKLGRDQARGPRLFGRSLRFSPDGTALAAVMQNDDIELWDVGARKKVRTIGDHDQPQAGRRVRVVLAGIRDLTSQDLVFAPDGKTLAASLGGASVRQFETETGSEVDATPGHASAVIAVGSDGRTVTTVSKESVRVWDADTGRTVRDWPLNPPAGAAAVSPDGKRVATASGGSVRLWDPTTGKEVGTIDTQRGDAAGLGFSPDGRLVATKEGLTAAVHLWDARTGKHVRSLGQDAETEFNGVVRIDSTGNSTPAVAFTADGRLLAAVGEKKQLCVWDVATGTLIREVTTPAQQPLAGFAFSANGLNLAAVTTAGTATVYEVATGEKRYELKPAGVVAAGAASPQGMAGVFSLEMLNRGNAHAGGVGFTPDGRLLVSAAGGPTARVWDVLTGQEVAQLKGHQGGISQLRLAADGRHLITGSADTTAMVWDLSQVTRVDVARETPMPADDLEALWKDLASTDTAAAFAAVRKLLADRPAAVAMLRERVRPVPPADEARVARLVADLGRKFDARRKASAELEQLGELAAPQLRKALEGTPSLDLKQRVEKLLEKATVQQLDGDRLRAVRAVEVLELAGTPEARQALADLAGGAPGARLTRDAKAAVARMAGKVN